MRVQELRATDIINAIRVHEVKGNASQIHLSHLARQI